MQAELMVSAKFPVDLAHKARVAAAKGGVSRSELIRQAVRRYLAEGSSLKGKERGDG